jgi:2-aminoethylphosphonate-pyruvate transaminase
MHAVILLAGYGSRLAQPDLPHKSLLPFGTETLLSRHLSVLAKLSIEKAHLVVGHNGDLVEKYVKSLNLPLPINFIHNQLYLTTGNTLSMVLGLKQCKGDVLILDGDVLYPRSVFLEYVQESQPTSFALVPVDIEDEEASKVLLKTDGTIHAFITKRHLTEEEKNNFGFGGEAIGFFKLAEEDVDKFIAHYQKHEKEYVPVLWEIPFTEFAREADISTWNIAGSDCFEIDTPEDYKEALASFNSQPAVYG